MGKRFRNELCVYCSRRPAVTGDHIFAREFFLESARGDLPQAPTCDECNAGKSKLEHYLATVLPFGGRHTDALDNLATLTPKRLRRNRKLHRELAAGYAPGRIPFDGAKLESLFALIVRGLLWFHWKVYLNDQTHAVRAAVLTPHGADMIDALAFRLGAAAHVNASVGNGAFQYEAKGAGDDPALSIWRFSVYGGILLSEGGDSAPGSSLLFVITGPNALIRLFGRVLDPSRRKGE